MTTTANPLLEKCCSPCNKCPDDGEITEVELLEADECSGPCGGGCGCGKGCKDNCGINIQSTNECLEVDTSECGVVKLTATCPPVVVAGDNVTVDVEPCDEGDNCSIQYTVNAECEDEKVKACSGDSTPGYLNQKLVAGDRIHIESVGCNGGNAHLVISADDCPQYDYPELRIQGTSQLINLTVGGPEGHTIYVSDKAQETYYNMVCIGFSSNKDVNVTLDSGGDAPNISWVNDFGGGWDMYTGNGDMATHKGVKILESGYYRVFGQLTVENNIGADADKFFLNLGRSFLRIKRGNKEIYLSTAKHGSYARQVILTGGRGINVSDDGVISVSGGSFSGSGTAPEGGGTVSISGSVSFPAGGGSQTNNGFDGPWATFNIDAYVDLYKNDIITLGYRPQSSMQAGQNAPASFRFTGANDTTTDWDRVFGGSMLGVNLVASHLFQTGETAHDKIYGDIYLNQ